MEIWICKNTILIVIKIFVFAVACFGLAGRFQILGREPAGSENAARKDQHRLGGFNPPALS